MAYQFATWCHHSTAVKSLIIVHVLRVGARVRIHQHPWPGQGSNRSSLWQKRKRSVTEISGHLVCATAVVSTAEPFGIKKICCQPSKPSCSISLNSTYRPFSPESWLHTYDSLRSRARIKTTVVMNAGWYSKDIIFAATSLHFPFPSLNMKPSFYPLARDNIMI